MFRRFKEIRRLFFPKKEEAPAPVVQQAEDGDDAVMKNAMLAMAVQRTFAIIKPDAVAEQATGAILQKIEEGGLRIVAMKRIRLSEALARGFYAVHKERPFYADLVAFMTSGPVVVLVLEGEGAIAAWRDLMGPTNSEEAPAGTIRGDHGTDIERNAAHGSDAPETARIEISYFFNATEIQGWVEALP